MLSAIRSHRQITSLYSSLGWKEKIHFYEEIHQLIEDGTSIHTLRMMEFSWLQLLRENNMNVLGRAVVTLKDYAHSIGFSTLKTKRQILKGLIGLSKMRRSQIDEAVVAIVITLFKHEKNRQTVDQLIVSEFNYYSHQSQFSSLTHPTFLSGVNIQDEQSKEDDCQTVITHNWLTEILIDKIKSYRKQTILLCFKIVLNLKQIDKLLFSQLAESLLQISKNIIDIKDTCKTKNQGMMIDQMSQYQLQLASQLSL